MQVSLRTNNIKSINSKLRQLQLRSTEWIVHIESFGTGKEALNVDIDNLICMCEKALKWHKLHFIVDDSVKYCKFINIYFTKF